MSVWHPDFGRAAQLPPIKATSNGRYGYRCSQWAVLGRLGAVKSKLSVLGILVAICLFAWVSIREDETALFVGVLTVGATFFGIVRQQETDRQDRLSAQQSEREARSDEERRQHKIETYAEILDLWFDVLLGSDAEKKKAHQRASRDLRGQIKKIVPWASDDVVKAYSALRTAEQTGLNAISAFGDLLIAIRADLGHPNNGVDAYTLASLFLNDVSRDDWLKLVSAES